MGKPDSCVIQITGDSLSFIPRGAEQGQGCTSPFLSTWLGQGCLQNWGVYIPSILSRNYQKILKVSECIKTFFFACQRARFKFIFGSIWLTSIFNLKILPQQNEIKRIKKEKAKWRSKGRKNHTNTLKKKKKGFQIKGSENEIWGTR